MTCTLTIRGIERNARTALRKSSQVNRELHHSAKKRSYDNALTHDIFHVCAIHFDLDQIQYALRQMPIGIQMWRNATSTVTPPLMIVFSA